jgi:hypothetical protein
MSLPTRSSSLLWLGFVATLCLSSLVAGCSVGTGPNTADAPTWSLADKKPLVSVDKAGDRSALGANADFVQPVAPPTSIVEVRKGDTLHAIALERRVSIKALMAANNLTSHTIQPGQKLTVPASPK